MAVPTRDLFRPGAGSSQQLFKWSSTGTCEVSGARVWLKNTRLEEVEETHKATLKLALDVANAKFAEFLVHEEKAQAEQDAADDAHRSHVSDMAKKIKFD